MFKKKTRKKKTRKNKARNNTVRKHTMPPNVLLQQIADKHGVSIGEVVDDIQEMLDETWNDPDPAARSRQEMLFPNGKPSVEAFLHSMARRIKP